MAQFEIEVEFRFIGAISVPGGVLVSYVIRTGGKSSWSVETFVIPHEPSDPNDGIELLEAA